MDKVVAGRAGSLELRKLAGWCMGASMLMAAALMQAKAAETIQVSGHPNWPPYSWQEGQKIVGIGTELAEIIFKDLGINVESKPHGNWKRVQSDAEMGNLDAIVAAYVTDDRKRYLDYHATPYTDDQNVVWVYKGKAFAYDKWDDLIGKRGTAMQGESYGEKFDEFIKSKLTIEWVNTPDQNLKKLEAGRADYYPFSLYGGQIQAKQLGFDGKVESLAKPISSEGVYIGIAKKSKFVKYIPQIEEAIRKLKADGTIDRLVKKYVALAATAKPNGQ